MIDEQKDWTQKPKVKQESLICVFCCENTESKMMVLTPEDTRPTEQGNSNPLI